VDSAVKIANRPLVIGTSGITGPSGTQGDSSKDSNIYVILSYAVEKAPILNNSGLETEGIDINTEPGLVKLFWIR
jgi:hypothetical protein